MSDYNFRDIVSAFEFGKSNPDSQISDWVKMNSSKLSEDDREYFRKHDCRYAEIDADVKGETYRFKLFSSGNPDAIDRLVVKFSEEKGYYRIDPMPGEWNPPVMSIFVAGEQSGFFVLDNWDDHPDFRGVKFLERGPVTFVYDLDCEDWDDLEFRKWQHYTERLESERVALWHYDSRLMAYIDREAEFDFRPVEDLFLKKA